MGHSTFLHIKKATCGLFVFFVFPKDVILKTTFSFPGFLLYPKVLEPRFNAELFAVLLSMPPSKTLLRRHLNTHFISLIGPETQTRKREHESQPGYIPLMPSNKIKVGICADISRDILQWSRLGRHRSTPILSRKFFFFL